VGEEEIYKPIPGYPGYEVSNLGRVKSLINKAHPNLIKDEKIDANGYSVVNIYNGHKSRPKKVCNLVASAFFDKYYNWYLIGHIDGNKQNNRLDNLKIISEAEYLKILGRK
jgi:hypothetical protein